MINPPVTSASRASAFFFTIATIEFSSFIASSLVVGMVVISPRVTRPSSSPAFFLMTSRIPASIFLASSMLVGTVVMRPPVICDSNTPASFLMITKILSSSFFASSTLVGTVLMRPPVTLEIIASAFTLTKSPIPCSIFLASPSAFFFTNSTIEFFSLVTSAPVVGIFETRPPVILDSSSFTFFWASSVLISSLNCAWPSVVVAESCVRGSSASAAVVFTLASIASPIFLQASTLVGSVRTMPPAIHAPMHPGHWACTPTTHYKVYREDQP